MKIVPFFMLFHFNYKSAILASALSNFGTLAKVFEVSWFLLATNKIRYYSSPLCEMLFLVYLYFRDLSLNKKFKIVNCMRQVTVYITDKEYSHFVELAKNLHYVKKIETDDEPTKEEIVSNLKRGFEEMQLIKKGKLKTTSLNDFLNEL